MKSSKPEEFHAAEQAKAPLGSQLPGPLNGIVILDLSRVLAGPYCTMLLAELGARVIKIEPPSGDDSRGYGPFRNGASLYFAALNRGKESIVLDLKHEDDRTVFAELLDVADVLVENFRPGTMEKLGFGWEDVHRKHKHLIYASASGFGHTGPWAPRPAYDMIVQGLGGIISVTGHKDAPPARIGISIGDLAAGLYATIGINAALYHREKTGEATKVDISMFDCQLSLMENPAMRYLATHEVPGKLGGRHSSISPFAIFATADAPIVIAAGNDSLYRKLCEALELMPLADDPRFTTNALRCTNFDALKQAIDAALSTHPAAHWLAVLEKAGVPAGPINTIADALQHPQVAARHMLVESEDPLLGEVQMIGNPIKIEPFAAQESGHRRAAPMLDADRGTVLAELAERAKVRGR
ncbi:MAG: CaiB/BaiF CoA transferase family protein [Methylovirgula sp.]